jgi:hypothetical protein
VRYFIFSCLLLLNSCSPTLNKEAINEPEEEMASMPPGKPGNVTYSCEGGKIQCLAERDSSGQVFIKFLTFDPHTTIKFEEIECVVDEYYLKILMMVDKQDTGCGDAYMHIEPLMIGIKPLCVDTTTLTGEKVIYQGPSVQVLM